MSNLSELSRARKLVPEHQQEAKLHVLVGTLSQLVDEKTWTLALNTTYGYIREVQDQIEQEKG